MPTPQEVVERMLRDRQGRSAGLPDRPRLGRRPHRGDRGKEIRRARFRRRSQSGAHQGEPSKTRPRRASATASRSISAICSKPIFSDATVITMYLLPRVNLDLRPKLLDLKPGTRLVSHDFSMDDWKPDEHVQMEVKDKYGGCRRRKRRFISGSCRPGSAGTWQWQLTVRRQAAGLRGDARTEVPDDLRHGRGSAGAA